MGRHDLTIGPDPGALLLIAKEPVAGRAKTRLRPPLTLAQAARVAEACLLDTLAEAATTRARRHVLVFDGDPDRWCPPGWETVPQRGGALGDRLCNAFTDVAGPAVVIAMDTPQLSAVSLQQALGAVTEPGTAVIGFTEDGGYWLLGLPADRDPVAVFEGVPMSTSRTGAAQHQRLVEIGYRVVELEILRDIDDYADLVAVVPLCPGGRLGTVMSGFALDR